MPDTIFETRTKIVGVTRDNRQQLLEELSEMDDIHLVREPNNPHDENAIAVLNPDGEKLGYIRSGLAKELVVYMELYPDSVLIGEILDITGDEVGKSYGCNIEITLINPDDRALISHQVNANATCAVILFVLGFFTLAFSIPAFFVAWPIGVFILLITVAFFATGAYLLKFSSALEKAANGHPELNAPKRSAKRRFVMFLSLVMAVFAALLIGCAIFSL